MGAGYIVGIEVGLSVLIGGIVGWLIGIPTVGYFAGYPEKATNVAIAMDLWTNHIRYVGVGTMLMGGIWTMFSLLRPILNGIKSSFQALQERRIGGHETILRTERDIPINYVVWGIVIVTACSIAIFYIGISDMGLEITSNLTWVLISVNIIYMLTIGFLLCAICTYLGGLVGSSSNPLSGITLSGVLFISLILSPILSTQVSFDDPHNIKFAVAITIIIAALTATAAAIAQDNIQDLKAGQMVGSTPWKQQCMQIIGVISAAFIIPPVLELLLNAYGIGGVLPRSGMDPNSMLAAPQATLMASIATGVYSWQLPWTAILAGALLALIVIAIDHAIKKSGMRVLVLAFGIGVYLPLSASMPLTIGGIMSYFVHRRLRAVSNPISEMPM